MEIEDIDLDVWLRDLEDEGGESVGTLDVGFLDVLHTVDVVFSHDDDGSALPDDAQVATLRGYRDRIDAIHEDVVAAIFRHYRNVVREYRRAIEGWGDDPDEHAPLIASSGELADLVELQSIHVRRGDPVGAFGLGFGASWEIEHGLGVRLRDWKVAEVGDTDLLLGE